MIICIITFKDNLDMNCVDCNNGYPNCYDIIALYNYKPIQRLSMFKCRTVIYGIQVE